MMLLLEAVVHSKQQKSFSKRTRSTRWSRLNVAAGSFASGALSLPFAMNANGQTGHSVNEARNRRQSQRHTKLRWESKLLENRRQNHQLCQHPSAKCFQLFCLLQTFTSSASTRSRQLSSVQSEIFLSNPYFLCFVKYIPFGHPFHPIIVMSYFSVPNRSS